MKRCGLYVRCSTDQQTVENQIRILTEVAKRAGWTIVRVFEDQAISGAKATSTSTASVQRIKHAMATVEEDRLESVTS